MPRPQRNPASIIGRRGTQSPQPASDFASTGPALGAEAPGALSDRSGYPTNLGRPRDGHQAARAGENSQHPTGGLPSEPDPPGIVVFRPLPPKRPTRARGPVTYPRFVRQVSPDPDQQVQPDPETGKWPRLPTTATPSWARRPVTWGEDRPPMRNAFEAWLRESAPVDLTPPNDAAATLGASPANDPIKNGRAPSVQEPMLPEATS
jgi:hypothetical protein